MTSRNFLILFSILSLSMSSCNSSTEKAEENIIVNNLSRDQYLDWFREAKFGMFIHWGPYSLLAGEWNGRKVQAGDNAECIMDILEIPVKEYRKVARNLNPVKFNALEWVQLAKATGMKYIVITSKHVDGFAMYHSKVSEYNIVDWTQFGRDPIKELADACAAEGIKLCFYYTHRQDYDEPGAYGNNWDFDNDAMNRGNRTEWGDNVYHKEKFSKYVEAKAKPQLRELLTNYGPIGLIWFDRGMYTPKQGLEFVKIVNDLQPACLVNSRVGNYEQELLGDYQSMADNGMPPGGLGEYWESAQTLNGTWGFNKFDSLWKSPETVIQRLVEIVSRGGNYLLNIGPTGEGEIPEATIDIFKKVGPWVKRNAESIYGTSANLFPELPWGYTTVKGSTIYLFVREWPKDRILTLPGLKNEVKSACFLIDKSINLPVKQSGNNTIIDLPQNPPDNPITVVVLEIEGSPVVDPPVVAQDTSGKIELNYLTVVTHGKTKTRFNRKGNFHISKWTGPDDSATWDVQVDSPGMFKVNISYSANEECAGKPFEITDGTTSIKKSVIPTGGLFEYYEFPFGYLNIKKPGKYSFTIRPLSSSDSYLMHLRSINLIPVKSMKTEGWAAN